VLLHQNRARSARGATIQSWKASNPRELLAFVVNGNDGKSRDELLHLFNRAVRENDEILDTLIEYWFNNNFKSLERLSEPSQREALKRARDEKASEFRAAINDAVERKARIMLMDIMMPNGKRLRACTGDECRELSKSTGRWLAAVSREMKPKQKVGEALTEDRLHELWGSV
jgi:CheY-like chemotaxis protein